MQLSFERILDLLSLSPSNAAVPLVEFWNILLYLIFFLALIQLMIMPDKNMPATLLTGFVLLATIIVKLSLAGGAIAPPLRPREFLIMMLNITTCLFPWLVAGMVRTRKRSNPVIPLGIFTGILGFVLTFVYWLVVQQ
jgi:hypothetical protein